MYNAMNTGTVFNLLRDEFNAMNLKKQNLLLKWENITSIFFSVPDDTGRSLPVVDIIKNSRCSKPTFVCLQKLK